MNTRQRIIALAIAVVAATLLATLVRPERVLVAEAPFYAQALMGVFAVGLWLCALSPFWVPEVVPLSWPRAAHVLRWIGGGLSLAIAGAALLFALREPGAKLLWVVALLAAFIAARHIRIALAVRHALVA
jgi:hypothetical protein